MHPDIPLAPRSLTLLCFLLSHQDKKLRIFDPRAGPAASQVLSSLDVLQAALPNLLPAGGWALVPQTIPALAGLGSGKELRAGEIGCSLNPGGVWQGGPCPATRPGSTSRAVVHARRAPWVGGLWAPGLCRLLGSALPCGSWTKGSRGRGPAEGKGWAARSAQLSK